MFHFHFHDPTLGLLCIGTDIKQTARTRIPLIRKKCGSASDKLHAALYKLTLTCISTCSGYLDSFYEIGFSSGHSALFNY